jgi:hypothetical protein
LNPGLRVPGGGPDVVARWLAGEPVFGPAERIGGERAGGD